MSRRGKKSAIIHRNIKCVKRIGQRKKCQKSGRDEFFDRQRAFNRALNASPYGTYQDYMNSHAWKSFRLRAQRAWDWSGCVLCGAHPTVLHHIDYSHVFRERVYDVVPVCMPHHDEIHAFHLADKSNVTEIRKAVEFILGCNAKTAGKVLGRFYELRGLDLG